MLDAAVDDAHVAGAERLRLVADRHPRPSRRRSPSAARCARARAANGRARLVRDAAEEHLLAADRVEATPGKIPNGSTPFQVRKGEPRLDVQVVIDEDEPVPSASLPALEETPRIEIGSSKITRLPSRRGSAAFASSARARAPASPGISVTQTPTASWIAERSPAAGRCSPSRRSPWRRTGPSTDGVLEDDVVELREVLERRREVGAELAAAVLDRRVVRVRGLEQAEARGPSSRRPRSGPRRASG